jgi:hypothetical protein
MFKILLLRLLCYRLPEIEQMYAHIKRLVTEGLLFLHLNVQYNYLGVC